MRIDIYPAGGGDVPSFSHDLDLQLGQCVTLRFADLVACGAFEGHADIWLPWQRDTQFYPRQVDCVPYVRNAFYEAATHCGSGASNISVENAYFRKAATRIFARLHCGPDLQSEAIIVYPTCGHPSPHVSLTEVGLIRRDGKMLMREINVPRNGILHATVRDLFSEAPAFLGEETSCVLRLSDKEVRLWGFHLTKTRHDTGLAMDHFFGG